MSRTDYHPARALVRALTWVVLGACISPLPAAEDDLDDLLDMGLENLMDIQVVTPSRKSQTVSQAPANVTVITAETIARRGYQTLEEVLRDVPGFEFTTSQPSGEYPTHFIFRGISDVGQTKALIMVDGVVRNDISNGWSRGLGYDFILSDVAAVEVISGPGSALYGANAYAGLINVITQAAGDCPRGLQVDARTTVGSHTTVAPEVLASYGSPSGLNIRLAGRWYKRDGDAGLDRPDPGSHFHGNYEPDAVLTTEYGNIANETRPDGTRKPLADGFGTDIDDIYLRGRIQRDAFALDLTYWDKREGLGSEVVGYEYFANTNGLDYRVHHRGLGALATYGFDLREDIASQSRLYFRSTRILPETGFVYTYKYQSVDNGTDPAVPDKVKGYHGEGFVAGLEQQLNADLSARNSLVLGLQLQQEIKQYFGISLGPRQESSSTIVHSTYTSEARSAQPVFFSHNAALFVQDEHQLTPEMTFTGGLRFDMDDEYGHVLNPRLTLVRSPATGPGLKLMYGQAFKAPTVFELFDEFRGNEDLEPERIATSEVELSYRVSRTAVLKAGCFHSKLTDIILVAPNRDTLKVPIGPSSEHLDYYQNIGSTSIGGVTLGVDLQWRRNLHGYGNYSYTAGEDGDELDSTARHKANLGINYLYADKLNVNLRANWRGRVKAPLSNRYFHPKDDATIAQVGYDYVTEASPDGYMDGELLLNLTLTGERVFGEDTRLKPQLIIRNLLGTDHMGIGRQSGSGVRPVDDLQPQVQNPSGFIPPYHPQPGREIYLHLRYGFSIQAMRDT